jgi:hypothetical protein
MADNITAPATGTVFATDEIGGVHIPLTKIVLGDGGEDDGPVSAGNPLPVAGPLTDTQLRAAAVPVSGPLTDGQLRAAAIPVSGPLTDAQIRAAALPVSGPLTDAQLRAAAIPVSGVVTGPLTDAQLRATAVPISGTVTGPLTDTQLRAAAVPVSGPLTDGQLRATAVPVSGPLTDAQIRAAALPVSGPLTDAQIRATALPVSGPITDAQLRASAVPVSASALPLPSGAATEATLATLAGAVILEDTAHASGDPGIAMLALRYSTDTPTTNNDGDYTNLKVDEEGRLKVASKPASYAAITGNITANGQTVFALCERFSNLMIHCAGTFSTVNVTFEGSLNSTNGIDGNWFTVQAIRSNANTIETTTGNLSAAPAYAWELSVNAMKYFRVRATAFTSGTQVWTMIPGTYATEPIPGAQVSGTQPVSGTVTATGVVGPAAHDAAISGNPLRLAGRALTANYATVATGDTADLVTTLVGALVVRPFAIPELDWIAAAPSGGIVNTTDVVLAAAAGAGLRRYMTGLQIRNASASVATEIVIKDGATVIWRGQAPLNSDPENIVFPTPLKTAANAALNVACITTGAQVYVNAQGYTAP